MADESKQPKRIKRTTGGRTGEHRAAVKPHKREEPTTTPTKPTAVTQSTTKPTSTQAQASSKPTSSAQANVKPTGNAATQTSASTLDISTILNNWAKSTGSVAQTYFGSNLQRKEALARKQFAVPADEQIFVVLDATIFGTCKAGLAICSRGIYLRDSTGSARTIGWGKLPATTIKADAQNLIIDNNRIITLDGVAVGNLLNTIKKKIAG